MMPASKYFLRGTLPSWVKNSIVQFSAYLSLRDKNLRRQYVAAMMKNMRIGSRRICLDNVNTPVSEI